jgi:hypothetical protein
MREVAGGVVFSRTLISSSDMTFDDGYVWVHSLDDLPPLVRRRLADARFNICPTCVDVVTRANGTPNLSLYFAVIDAIERTLDRAEQRFNQTERRGTS